MVKMICDRDHSSMVWGSPRAGDVFEVDQRYAGWLRDQGLAHYADPKPAPPADPEPAPKVRATKPDPEPAPPADPEPVEDDAVASTIAALEAAVKPAPEPEAKPRRRGGRRRSNS